MLCQSILGLTEERIVEDYHLSSLANFQKHKRDGSAAGYTLSKTKIKGKLDLSVFSGAPKEATIQTLAMIKSNYGSVNPGYLNAIGFDEDWRRCFTSAISKQTNTHAAPPNNLHSCL